MKFCHSLIGTYCRRKLSSAWNYFASAHLPFSTHFFVPTKFIIILLVHHSNLLTRFFPRSPLSLDLCQVRRKNGTEIFIILLRFLSSWFLSLSMSTFLWLNTFESVIFCVVAVCLTSFIPTSFRRIT